MSCKDIYDDMLTTSGDDFPSYTFVKNCLADFKYGRNSVVNEHRWDVRKMQRVQKMSRLLMIC